jgi:hypothetical protein
VNSRKGKRAQSEADQLAKQSKSKKSAPNPGVPLLSATVGDHCDGCGKRNHHRRDCLSGKTESRHPDFNEHGPWRDSESYRKIKEWLISRDRAGEHPVLKYNMRADGGMYEPRVKSKPDRSSKRGGKEGQNDSGPDRGRSAYRGSDTLHSGGKGTSGVHWNDQEQSGGNKKRGN